MLLSFVRRIRGLSKKCKIISHNCTRNFLRSSRSRRQNLYTRRLTVHLESLSGVTNLTSAFAVLLDFDPHHPLAVSLQTPNLDLDHFVMDLRLHRRATEIRTVAAARMAVASLQHDVCRLIRTLARTQILHEVPQVVSTCLWLAARELFAGLHHVRQISRHPMMMTMSAVVTRYHRLIHRR